MSDCQLTKWMNFVKRLGMSSEVFDLDKQKQIADAAFEVFATYGFRKTSMQLIAQKAGMSRPALYLHFENKQDVFRFLTLSYYADISASISGILQTAGTPAQTLAAVFDAFDPDGVMAVLLDAEHGQDILDAKAEIAHADVAQIEREICGKLAAWLRHERAQGRVVCDDAEVASATILAAFYGLKSPPPSYAEFKARAAQLALMLGDGLAVR